MYNTDLLPDVAEEDFEFSTAEEIEAFQKQELEDYPLSETEEGTWSDELIEEYGSESDFSDSTPSIDQDSLSTTSTELRYPYIHLGNLEMEIYKMQALASMVKPVRGLHKSIRVMALVGGENRDIGSVSGSQLLNLIELVGREEIKEAYDQDKNLLKGDNLYILAY